MRLGLAFAISLAAFPGLADEAPRLVLATKYVVAQAPASFGGLSGLVVAENGRRAEVLSDRAIVFQIHLSRDENHGIEGLAVLNARFFYRFTPNIPTDTEGLARLDDDTLLVSIENPPEILVFDNVRSWPDARIAVDAIYIEQPNRRLEALAVSPAGEMHTLPEIVPLGEEGFPILRYRNGAWERRFMLPDVGGFRPVGADFDVGGRLYILERAASLLGFRTRIRRVTWHDGAQDAPPLLETLIESDLGQFDNLEGLSIWTTPEGETRLLAVSDNNYLSVQRTEFVEFTLIE